MIPFVLNCIATGLALNGYLLMVRNHVRNHDDAWLDLPADGNVCNKCDDIEDNDCQ